MLVECGLDRRNTRRFPLEDVLNSILNEKQIFIKFHWYLSILYFFKLLMLIRACNRKK